MRILRLIGLGGREQDDSASALLESAQQPEPAEDAALHQDATQIWPYSRQYKDILEESHRDPPTACGSPTFIWHLGLWPRSSHAEGAGVTELHRGRSHLKGLTKRFYREVSALLASLQRKGCVGGAAADFKPTTFETPPFQLFSHSRVNDAHAESAVERFLDVQPQSISFILWWRDDDTPLNGRAPEATDLRVVVIAQSHFDHVTLTFHIDAAKPYGLPQIDDTEEQIGGKGRRARIAALLDHVRDCAGEQIRQGHIDASRIPEQDVDAASAEKLLEASEYFYDGVWREFMNAFELTYDDTVLRADSTADTTLERRRRRVGARFADFRGLVMSVRGLETPNDAKRRATAQALRDVNAPELARPAGQDESGKAVVGAGRLRDRPDPATAYTGFGPFDVFDAETGEPNAVLKSFWPFIRRFTRWGDYRQLVGCGILSWRALFVSALGAPDDYGEDQEYPDRRTEVPGLHLPEGERLARSASPEADAWRERREISRPNRYLLLTKGEPNREQIGRFVERINALGAMRLFALKYVSDIKNASHHLRVLGHALDGILSTWSQKRQEIEDTFQTKKARIDARRSAIRPKRRIEELRHSLLVGPDIPAKAMTRISQERIDALNALILENERKLIELGGQLDYVFEGGVGRFSYAVNRSRYFAEEFEALWPSLEIGNVDGWMNYQQFVERGPKPAFDFIKGAGERLTALRERLQVVTATIQTTALVVETEATRTNTDTLRNFARMFKYVSTVTLGLAGLSALSYVYDKINYGCIGAIFDLAWWFGYGSDFCIERLGYPPEVSVAAMTTAVIGITAFIAGATIWLFSPDRSEQDEEG